MKRTPPRASSTLAFTFGAVEPQNSPISSDMCRVSCGRYVLYIMSRFICTVCFDLDHYIRFSQFKRVQCLGQEFGEACLARAWWPETGRRIKRSSCAVIKYPKIFSYTHDPSLCETEDKSEQNRRIQDVEEIRTLGRSYGA
jgi:8-oxo-dGTP pyrophosphatase MutT (NUDIX family)